MTAKEYADKFEKFLQDKHAMQYGGLDDEMPDDYSEWLQDLDADTYIQYVGEFCAKEANNG